MVTAAIYTYTAVPNPASVARQRAACEALARLHGYTDIDVFQDEAGDRSALDRLLADGTAGTVTVLVVHRLDRLGRQHSKSQRVRGQLDAAGVRILEATRLPWVLRPSSRHRGHG
ncbi:recombinase family protein [Microbacterium lacticum]